MFRYLFHRLDEPPSTPAEAIAMIRARPMVVATEPAGSVDAASAEAVELVTDAPDPYKILQVDPEAEDEVIQAAYRRLAQKYHPDRSTGQEAMDRMVAINAAWETIGDPKRRASFDLARSAAAAAQQAPASPTSGAPGAGAGRAVVTGGWTGRPCPGAPSGSVAASSRAEPRPPETVSRDWSPGRSTLGGGYDAKTMRAPRGLPLRARRPATRRAASSTSGDTRGGRSARSVEPISSTSSGSIGCPSVGRIGTRSTGSCDGRDGARARRPTRRSGEACSGAAELARGPLVGRPRTR